VTDTLRAKRTTVVLVTHDPEVAGRADRIVRLRSGLVVEERRPS
jgi:predicted ABC-type transport system involved in lysophospholipase L1 biosynthesis ATPase subunit